MCQNAHDTSRGSHHAHSPESRPRRHNHDEPERTPASRRDFLRILMGGALSGASAMELAWHRAAWANAAPPSDAKLFDVQQAAPGVFFAQARPQAEVNCNAAVFVRSKDVVVVDAHSKPSAAAALMAQIRREVTEKPVRYLINTHFHWDHTQGNHAYRAANPHLDFIATETTKNLMSELAVKRLKESLDTVPQQIEKMRKQAEQAKSAGEKAFCAEQIRQMEAYREEMKNYTLELPTITFEKSYELRDPAFDLHLEFHGHAHTAGDLFVFCPQQRALATGDASHGWLPNLADGFPKSWPQTIDGVAKSDFAHVLGGHGPLQSDRTVMMNQRNYIEELASKVEQAKQAGQSLAEMQQRMTVASLRSLQSNGYEAFLMRSLAMGEPHWGPMPPLQEDVSANVADVYKNLDRG